jgi:uncharacterized protein (DUF58 family)
VAAPPHRTFPLVPRHRLTGGTFGAHHSLRRGRGTDIAGSRNYVPGDQLAWIDWKTSARLSAVRDDDAFLVREHYADEAPRVVIIADHHPSMALYPTELPWLAKADALRHVIVAVVAAAQAARAYVGYLDFSGAASREGNGYWIAPRRLSVRQIEHRLNTTFDAPDDLLERGIDELVVRRRDAGAGCFVFVASDFLRPPPLRTWLRARARQWDLVPVIIQDPVWEQSFPAIGDTLLPVADPTTGRTTSIQLTATDVQRLRVEHAARLESLIRLFHSLDFDPVVLGTSQEREIDLAFLSWANRRRFHRRRAA